MIFKLRQKQDEFTIGQKVFEQLEKSSHCHINNVLFTSA